ncbi:MAG TPA: ATP-binding cassette domain-containing protein, partial [Polyangiaceae bacterium]
MTKWFGSRRVLDDVSLEVGRGERVVVLGENGCGKSTLLQIVCGVVDADEGELRLPDAIGYAPERPDIPDHLLAREWLDLVASLKRARPITNELGVSELLGRKVGALSLGQRQRVSLV